MAEKASTAYGKRGAKVAKGHVWMGRLDTAGAVVGTAGAIAGAVAGDKTLATINATSAAANTLSAKERFRKARETTAKTNAVDGILAKGRGGSAILGNKGIVPKGGSEGSRADKLHDKTSMNGPTSEGGPADHDDVGGVHTVREHQRISLNGKIQTVKAHERHA